MNKALFLSLTNDFLIGFKIFIKSLIRYNSWFIQENIPIIIMDLGLSEKNKSICNSYYSNLHYIKPKYENYKKTKCDRLQHASYKNNFYKLDLFSYEQYDRIVSMDVDILIRGDISFLFNMEDQFSATRCYVAWKDDFDTFKINAGVLSVGGSFLNLSTYLDLLDLSYKHSYVMAEQDLLSIYFGRSKKVTYFSGEYNYQKRMRNSVNEKIQIPLDKIKVLHYTGTKPWQVSNFDNGFYDLEKLWWNEYYR